MPKKTEDSETQQARVGEGSRRYRSIAEIRRDFFPEAPASLFELGHTRSQQEVAPKLTVESQDA